MVAAFLRSLEGKEADLAFLMAHRRIRWNRTAEGRIHSHIRQAQRISHANAPADLVYGYKKAEHLVTKALRFLVPGYTSGVLVVLLICSGRRPFGVRREPALFDPLLLFFEFSDAPKTGKT